MKEVLQSSRYNVCEDSDYQTSFCRVEGQRIDVFHAYSVRLWNKHQERLEAQVIVLADSPKDALSQATCLYPDCDWEDEKHVVTQEPMLIRGWSRDVF